MSFDAKSFVIGAVVGTLVVPRLIAIVAAKRAK